MQPASSKNKFLECRVFKTSTFIQSTSLFLPWVVVMGKGQGKKGRKEGKLAVKKLNPEPKIPGFPKPEKPARKAVATSALPLGHQQPFTKKPQHAKWPALFKRHLGVIESHVKNLDRVMQSTKSEMDRMDEKDRLEWELGERGNWRVICEMMDRAREVLVSARKAARGIVSV
jgi:hypothetical protein